MSAMAGLGNLPRRLTTSDWEPTSLFGASRHSMLPQLIGVMMRVPEIQKSLNDIAKHGLNNRQIAQLAYAWVSGMSIQEIAKQYFSKKDGSDTEAITEACRAIYRSLGNAGPWGISALSKLGPSGLDFEKLSPETRRTINNLPAMLYHGVSTENAVLMRMNFVPRTIAERLGEAFQTQVQNKTKNARHARIPPILGRRRLAACRAGGRSNVRRRLSSGMGEALGRAS